MRLSLSLLVSGAVLASAAHANPQGAQVVHGSATFSQINANTLQINNSRNAIINWQQFGIGAGQTTRFVQPDHRSAVLNRVIGSNPSQILGNLNSNGRVFLINQHGLMVGAGAQINTAGFFGSTLNITNEDFLSGNLKFEGGGFGGIDNQGVIHAGQGGHVVLVAPDISNSGSIEVDDGNIMLAAGESVTITSLADSAIEFEVQSADNSVTNLGSIEATNGAAGLFAGSLAHSGTLNATGLVQDADGTIRLVASDLITVDGQLLADGEAGGKIQIQSTSGDVVFAGTASAQGTSGAGGEIEVLGDRVGLFDEASLDVSGASGGGAIWVGGDFRGKGELQLATMTQVGADATIRADATTSGDGGDIIVWAEDYTRFSGSASATGGTLSGDGGFIEISGKEILGYDGSVNASALNGEGGTVLFDPRNLTIQSGGLTAAIELLDNIWTFDEPDTVTDVTIDPLAVTGITDTGTAVLLQASNNLNVLDDIITNEGGGGGNITLEANNDININATIFTDNGNLILNSNADNAGGGQISLVNATLDTGTGILTADNMSVATGTSRFTGTSFSSTVNNLSVTGGILQLDTNLDITNSMNLAGGTIELQDDLVTGTYSINFAPSTSWSGGNLVNLDTELAFYDASGETLTLSGPANKRLQFFELNVGNGGLLDIQGNGDLQLVNSTIYYGDFGDGTPGQVRHSGNGDITAVGSSSMIAEGGLFVNAAGDTRVEADVLNSSSLTPGRVLNISGNLAFTGNFNNPVTQSTVTVQGGSVGMLSDLPSSDFGRFVVSPAGALIIGRSNFDLTNGSGQIDGLLRIQNGGTLITGPNLEGTGSIQLDSGTLALGSSPFELQNGQGIFGNGTVVGDVVNISGVIGAGGPFTTAGKDVTPDLGTLAIVGNYVQGPNGALVLYVSDSVDELRHSVFGVTGDTQLAGNLVLEFQSSSFELATTDFRPLQLGGSVAGRFDRVIDANGTIYDLSFNGGVFTISGASPSIPEIIAQELRAFLTSRRKLLEFIRRNRDEAEETIALILIRELDEENEDGEREITVLVCR